jgi:hypothetical protein
VPLRHVVQVLPIHLRLARRGASSAWKGGESDKGRVPKQIR